MGITKLHKQDMFKKNFLRRLICKNIEYNFQAIEYRVYTGPVAKENTILFPFYAFL